MYFYNTFLNHSFHIILNNNTWKLLPNRPIVTIETEVVKVTYEL